MKIVTQLNFESYSRLLKTLYYKRVFVIATIVIGVFFLLLAVLGLIIDELNHLSYILSYGISGLIILLAPYVTITLKAKRSFFSNKMLQEEIAYEFTKDKIIMTGTSFRSEMEWSKIYKVREVKDWYLIYQSKQAMNLIPKDALRDQQTEFNQLLKQQEGLKLGLLSK